MYEENSSKKILWASIAIVLVLLVLAGVYYFFIRKDGALTAVAKPLFGGLISSDIAPGENANGAVEQTPTPDGDTSQGALEDEPLFRQLSSIPIAGAVAVERSGKNYVRYVARETGHVFEVDSKTGVSVELTNTLIPRVYEALWVKGGNSVVLRYLSLDPISRKEQIKTYLAHLDLPIQNAEGVLVPTALGSLRGEFLPNDISAVSISSDGTQLFYLEPISEGVSGKIVTIATMSAKEVFRNSFSEWLPQLLNDGTIILTTKPSANVPGYSYLYNPTTKTLTRIVRQKNGLTTLGEPQGERVIYSQNITGNTTLSLYDKNGVSAEEGITKHEAQIPLATLPEKCVWSKSTVYIYCGAFTSTPRATIPDDWYQGVLSFSDSFWVIDTKTIDITFLADPEKSIQKEFDVFMPFMGTNESYFYFTNRKDNTLWQMRIVNQVPEVINNASAGQLTPEEMKDAAGSTQIPGNINP